MSSLRSLLFILSRSPPDEPVDWEEWREEKEPEKEEGRGSQQPGAPPPSSPLPIYFTVYCLLC